MRGYAVECSGGPKYQQLNRTPKVLICQTERRWKTQVFKRDKWFVIWELTDVYMYWFWITICINCRLSPLPNGLIDERKRLFCLFVSIYLLSLKPNSLSQTSDQCFIRQYFYNNKLWKQNYSSFASRESLNQTLDHIFFTHSYVWSVGKTYE